MPMSKLNLEDWSRLAEICAAVVVILSLGYVALEIEQNTKAVQAASYQALITGLTEVDLAVVTNPELDRVVSLGEKTPAELSAQEWSTFHRYALARTGQFELAFIAFENGALDELQWSGAASVDVWRVGSSTPIKEGATGGSYVDNTETKGGGTYEHYVCVAGGTATCSNTTVTVF